MIDLIKKALLTGIGVASLTKEKIDELSKELIKKGQLSEQEGQQFVEEMINRAEESKKSLQKQTETIVEKTLSKMNLARNADLIDLKVEIERLRDEIVVLQEKSQK